MSPHILTWKPSFYMHTKVPKVYMKLLLPEAPFGSSALILAGLFPSCRLFFLPSLFPRSQYSDTVVPFSSAISIVSIDWPLGNFGRRTKCESLLAFLISAVKDDQASLGGGVLLLELSVIMGSIFLSLL